MGLGRALEPQPLSDSQERALRPARRPLDPHLLGQLFESLQRVVSIWERPHQLLRESVGHDLPPCSAPPPIGESQPRNDDQSGMEKWKEGRSRAGGTPGCSQGGPLLPYRRSCERRTYAVGKEQDATGVTSTVRGPRRVIRPVIGSSGRPAWP